MTTDVHHTIPALPRPTQNWAAAFYLLITLAVVLAAVRAFLPPHATLDTTHEVQ